MPESFHPFPRALIWPIPSFTFFSFIFFLFFSLCHQHTAKSHRPNMNSHNASEDSPDAPLLHDGPHNHPCGHRKELPLIVFGLLLLASLVAFSGYRASNYNARDPTRADVSSSTKNPNPIVPSSKWHPVSRGVSAGVSEKSNRLFAGKAGDTESFPWNNSMLSWQRTAYHFQPEKNWMNGNSLFCSLLNLLPK